MDSALIVSSNEKYIAFFAEILKSASIGHIVDIHSCGDARRLLLERDFDLVLINAPLKDETGEMLARFIAAKGASQVILVVKTEFYEAVSAVCEDDGVLTIAKPINKTIFWSALTLARSAQSRLTKVKAENAKLKQKIEDIRVIDRAKLILISYMNMTEKEAHRYIEKEAMDSRQSRREVAEGIIKTYEN
ncbi:MAG: ANTAR domain-containing protein [Lachnospiraceae bacterium]|nr:ANTAR domain-containing protein [Lachnospiraceae bacterium]